MSDLDPYDIGVKLGEISSNMKTIYKKLDSMETQMNNLEGCHKETREELLKLQGRQNGISEKKEWRLKTVSLQVGLIGLISAIVTFLIDFFSCK